MNLKHLQAFLTLSEAKSFTKTAALLGCAQSGVTAQIKLLEEELHVRLFERMGKNVSLTAEGERLIPYARKMLSLSSKISSLYQDFGRLTIGVTESIASYLLGPVLKEFLAIYPDTEIFLNILDGKDCCQMLADGEIDFAIVLDEPVKCKTLDVLLKRKENIILSAASTHELSASSFSAPKDLSSCSLLLPLPDCPYRKIFEQQLALEGIQIKAALETGSISVIKESSVSGVGLGLLPEFAVKKELIYHMLERIPFKMNRAVYIQILMHPDKWLSPGLKNFLEILKRHLLQPA